jgi:hypothetical protein
MFGVDWLLRIWDDKSKTLYYQMGIGSAGSESNNVALRLKPRDGIIASHRQVDLSAPRVN